MGTGLFYVRPELVAALPPLYGYFDHNTMKPWNENSGVQKYEKVGTQAEALILSIGQMLDLHEAIGIERVQARLHYLKQYWAQQVKSEKNIRFADRHALRDYKTESFR